MDEEETKRVNEQEQSAAATDFSAQKIAENDEKSIILLPLQDSKPPPTTLSDAADCHVEKTDLLPKNRDAGLAQVEIEKKLALIKAWEENEKTKADNKAYKKLSAIDAWENTKRAAVEAQLKQIEEKFERKKAEYGEKMKNKVALVHKAAEEKRAMIEANRGKEFLTVEEAAAKFRTTGSTPKKSCACFSY
ncbi:Remorin family protein [Perilla frutescens var. hirtella]|nr:Remorin family protein [Perilla frutescens var. frutescens]KAH6787380.1 Remorin family protein [Perilla frutescens var. hirtella]